MILSLWRSTTHRQEDWSPKRTQPFNINKCSAGNHQVTMDFITLPHLVSLMWSSLKVVNCRTISQEKTLTPFTTQWWIRISFNTRSGEAAELSRQRQLNVRLAEFSELFRISSLRWLKNVVATKPKRSLGLSMIQMLRRVFKSWLRKVTWNSLTLRRNKPC